MSKYLLLSLGLVSFAWPAATQQLLSARHERNSGPAVLADELAHRGRSGPGFHDDAADTVAGDPVEHGFEVNRYAQRVLDFMPLVFYPVA